MDEPYIGEIRAIAFNYAPRGWALCNGQTLPINQNQALFSLLGVTYGGDGVTNFKLPDLRSRVPIGQGQGPGLTSYSLGQAGGAESVALTQAQLPAHVHTVTGTLQTGQERVETTPIGDYLAPGSLNQYSTGPKNTSMGAVSGTTGTAGGGQPHDNRQPYIATYYVIAVEGYYPTRN